MSCEVSLIAYTPSPARVVASAAKLCYSPSRASCLFDGLDAGAVSGFLKKLRSAGHLSPFEHASFTFAADGLSRVTSHQLVRHRVASFSQQSQRYVRANPPGAVMPPSVSASLEAAALFESQLRSAAEAYERLISLGIPKEDARFILPHGAHTSLILTMNARELHHFFSLRLCRRAQWEIRGLAGKMLALSLEAARELFDPAGPPCLTEGRCREAEGCGRLFSSMEEILSEIDD
ncbi:MAG: FAD-dependent thymidylate synthase [Synergistaceae bacterium]|nr:FAD-dependent thymidylate synthase [Synergistaceae bacterium]